MRDRQNFSHIDVAPREVEGKGPEGDGGKGRQGMPRNLGTMSLPRRLRRRGRILGVGRNNRQRTSKEKVERELKGGGEGGGLLAIIASCGITSTVLPFRPPGKREKQVKNLRHVSLQCLSSKHLFPGKIKWVIRYLLHSPHKTVGL